MKKRIGLVGFWNEFVPEESIVVQLMQKYYDVEITDPNEADYIIFSSLGTPFEYLKYPQVRIMECYENVIPNYNFTDYCISSIPAYYEDRGFYLPYCLRSQHFQALKNINRDYSLKNIEDKPYFASFIASHESENSLRGDFFKELSKYKHVESVGSYLNNMEDGRTVDWTNNSKTDFQRKCKFNLCFESTKLDGFVTEKLVDAFFAESIPVYFGSDYAKTIFNPNAFIHCSDYETMDKAIERIIELDNNDDEYLKMLSTPILLDPTYYETKMEALDSFIQAIFDQPLEKAFRRPRCFLPKFEEDFILSKMNTRKLTDYSMKELAKAMLLKFRKGGRKH